MILSAAKNPSSVLKAAGQRSSPKAKMLLLTKKGTWEL